MKPRSQRDIAAVIGRHLNLPVTSISREEADAHFGGFALFAGMDVPASSAVAIGIGFRPHASVAGFAAALGVLLFFVAAVS